MAERQKRQQQIAPADAAVANGSERRSPLPGDRGDRGSKVTNSPQPARPPPARQINGRAQPARPAPFPERRRRALPGQGRSDQARVGASVPPPGPPGPFFPPPLFALLAFAGFHLQTGNLTALRRGRGGGGEGSVTRTARLCAACPPGKALSLPLPLHSPTLGCGFRSQRRALRNQA